MNPTLSAEISQAFAKLQPSSRCAYQDAIKRFLTALQVTTLEQALKVKPLQVTRAVEAMQETYSASSIALSLAAASRVYKRWLVHERIKRSPLIVLDRPRIDTRSMQENVLRPDEEKALLDLITKPRDKAIALAILLQGWRADELCRLRWGDIWKVDGKWIAKIRRKGAKDARMVLKPEVYVAARAIAGLAPADAPFIAKDATGRPLTRHDVYNMMRRYATRLQLGHKITPHGLRATFLSRTIQERGIEVARQLGGHNSISTTQRYSRFTVME